MKKYLIIIEPTTTGFSAYSPNLPDVFPLAERAKKSSATCTNQSHFIWTDFVRRGNLYPSPKPIPPTPNCRHSSRHRRDSLQAFLHPSFY